MGSCEKHFGGGAGGGWVGNRLIASEKLSKVYLLWPFGNYEKKRKTCSTTRLSQRVYKRDFCSHVFANPDGLAISNAAPRDTENIKKEICRVFNQNGLPITIEANKQVINFLDVTFNLNNSTYQPYTKPNTTLQYVHREINHPPITIKNIPAGINRRLSSLSSDKASHTLHYEPSTTANRRNRQRNNILWYNGFEYSYH